MKVSVVMPTRACGVFAPGNRVCAGADDFGLGIDHGGRQSSGRCDEGGDGKSGIAVQ